MANKDDTPTEPIPVMSTTSGVTPGKPFATPIRVDAAGLSHPGKVRKNNEDHFLVARVGRSLETLITSLPDGDVPTRFDDSGYVMMVADGMGGAAAGEVASRCAIRTFVNIVLDVPDWLLRPGKPQTKELMERATSYYRRIDQTLAEQAESDPQLSGMGTTMTVAYAVGKNLFLAHAGDSRAYLYRHGEVRQLTRDHTHVQTMVEAGVLTREEAATHRLRNVLTNVLGGQDRSVDVEMHRLALADRDRILLCSDGLTEVVHDAEIGGVLERMSSPEVACRALIELALERGAPDNVTVLTARFGAGGSNEPLDTIP
jgi:protein phosphatase